MNKLLFGIVTALLFSACTPNAVIKEQPTHNSSRVQTQSLSTTFTANDIKHPKGENATPDEIAECQKQGGTISKQGLLAHDFCVVEFTDKGKVCSDGRDCQAGDCITESNSPDHEVGTPIKGVCPANNIPFGCYGMVNKGKFGGFLCVD